MRFIPRGRLDISWSDLLTAGAACVRADSAETLEQRIAALWPGAAVVSHSLRHAFDAMLAVLHWPAGSEVLVSSITVDGMLTILRDHGLVPVCVDVQPDTLLPSVEALQAACSASTRGLLIAHLLGGYADIQPIQEFAQAHTLQLWEDCAQAFVGDCAMGHPRSDAVFFSFGPIKTATALGCGVARFRDPALCEQVQTMLARWPRQPTAGFARRVAKYMGIKLLGTSPRLFAALVQAASWCGEDYDVWVTHWTRGATNVMRRRPCAAQLALLWRRLRHFDASHIEARRTLGLRLQASIGSAAVMGSTQHRPTYWLVAVLSRTPDALRRRLVQAGFDATRGSTKMRAHGSAQATPHAARLMRQVVYVPLYVGLRAADVQRLCARIQNSDAREAPDLDLPRFPEHP